ncbi:response regulator [Minwuia thermotolerans]|nr:response regulator [Minwuia thermotolerans]ANK80868.1 MAG: hypothetical protein TEF_08720 [Rhizobiales bacterium NRL2]
MKILVVDDDRLIRDMFTNSLETQGHEVTVATDGDDALRLLGEMKPDVVLCDIIMPNREGIETIAEISRTEPGLPVIAITGGGKLGPAPLLEAARRAGASAALKKPFGTKVLLNTIHQVMSGKEAGPGE